MEFGDGAAKGVRRGDALEERLGRSLAGGDAGDHELDPRVDEGSLEVLRILSRSAKVGIFQFAGKATLAAHTHEKLLRVDRVKSGLAPLPRDGVSVSFGLGRTRHISLETKMSS